MSAADKDGRVAQRVQDLNTCLGISLATWREELLADDAARWKTKLEEGDDA